MDKAEELCARIDKTIKDQREHRGDYLDYGKPDQILVDCKTLIEQQRQEIERLRETLKPFAQCVEQISPGESDEEWAKFRLLIKDYRRAQAALEEKP
jgi:hypothetical protein